MSKPRDLLPALAIAAVVAALAALYTALSAQSVINSDGANEVLQGLDFWRGNVLLHGWWLAQDTFYLTDAPLYGAIARLQGLGPEVVHEGAGIVYAVVVVVAALLARGRERGARGRVAAAVAAAVLAVPPPLLLQGQMHLLGVAFVLLGLLLLETWPESLWPVAGTGVLAAAAMVSDPLVTVVFAPALALVVLARALRIPAERRRDLALLAALGVALLATRAVPRLISVLGGFERPRPLSVGIVPLTRLAANLQLTARDLLLLFRADVVDAPGDWIAWVHLLGIAAVAAGAGLALRRWRGRAPEDFVPQVLVVAGAASLATFALSTQPVDLASTRILSPLAAIGAVLAGRMLAPYLLSSHGLRTAGAVAVASLLLTVPLQLARPAAPAPTAELERWLASRGLTYGLGSYWEASIVTLDTGGRVIVRCVDSPSGTGRRAAPDRWFQDQGWFAPAPGRPAEFVVFSPGEHTANITEAGALAAFGPPAEIHHVGPYEVMVYGRDLLAELGP